jgi:hypothetical protein
MIMQISFFTVSPLSVSMGNDEESSAGSKADTHSQIVNFLEWANSMKFLNRVQQRREAKPPFI